MEKLPKGVYTQEFRLQAVKLVLEQGLTMRLAAQQLMLLAKTLGGWVKAARAGQLQVIGTQQRKLGAEELKLAQLQRELARVKMERDFLKKCAAYFAKSPT
jgi:transposase